MDSAGSQWERMRPTNMLVVKKQVETVGFNLWAQGWCTVGGKGQMRPLTGLETLLHFCSIKWIKSTFFKKKGPPPLKMIWCCQFLWFLKMSWRSCGAPTFPRFNQIGDKSLQRKANRRSVTGGTGLWNEFISLESLVWSCEQNIFLYSSASKSQCNNVFQHNLKWCWREKTTWQRRRGCQRLSNIAHALMDYLIISPCRRSALLMVGNMAFTSLKE